MTWIQEAIDKKLNQLVRRNFSFFFVKIVLRNWKEHPKFNKHKIFLNR
jgi:hypothetical protein